MNRKAVFRGTELGRSLGAVRQHKRKVLAVKVIVVSVPLAMLLWGWLILK